VAIVLSGGSALSGANVDRSRSTRPMGRGSASELGRGSCGLRLPHERAGPYRARV